jgi:tight adherence protein B
MTKAGRLAVLAAAAAALLVISTAAQATTSEGTARIVGVDTSDKTLRLVFETEGFPDGAALDPESIAVQVGGASVAGIESEPVADNQGVMRTAVLAIDNSQSMEGTRLEGAKAAAKRFISALPGDVEVGLVTFGATTELVIERTADRDSVMDAIDAIEIDDTVGTALFDGTALAFDATGDEGVRSVIVVTDGNEYGNSDLSLEEAVGRATDDGVNVDAVYISEDPQQPPELQQLINGAGGKVVTADDAGLAAVIGRFAEAIKNQVVITGEMPANVASSGRVTVSARVGDLPVSDSAFLPKRGGRPAPAPVPTDFGPRALPGPTPLLTQSALPIVLGAIFLALVAVLYVALSTLGRDDKQGRVRRRLSFYTLTGRPQGTRQDQSTALGASHVARSAVELASKVVQKRDFESSLGLRLEAAGVPLRAAEWMLIHVGVAVGAALMALLISGGKILPTVLGLALGLGLPFGYLIHKESRRTSAFLSQLPETLQLLAGSLSAGYSLPQAMDAVVREEAQPITGEFNRALVEARLGVPIEDALDGIGERMKSKDFAWVVMAIRIQREVGGNLAELLTTVAGTLRERERLRRQVKVLSAEGRLSAWILGLLPIAFAAYLMLAQPAYLEPLVTEPLGWAMVGLGLFLLAVGAVWLRKTVKVEV